MRLLALASAFAVVALIASPAFADIKTFNAAVAARDFKKATAEAATTWPTLDKSRADIALIAREFGFAAYIAQDYAAAKTYSEFAAANAAGGDDAAVMKVVANVLLRTTEYRQKPSDETRDALFGALEARKGLSSFDTISFMGTEALVGHDIGNGRWRDATASAELASKLAGAGGPYFRREQRKYALFQNVAEYRVSQKTEIYDRLSSLQEAVWADAAATSSDEAANEFVDLFWEVSAWRSTISAHLKSRNVRAFIRSEEERRAKEKDLWVEKYNKNERMVRLMGRELREEDEACKRRFDQSEKPNYPSSALHRGFVGSVILRADVADDGKLHNPEILAAVPEKFFGDAVLKKTGEMRYLRGKEWDPAICKMARPGATIIFEFVIP